MPWILRIIVAPCRKWVGVEWHLLKPKNRALRRHSGESRNPGFEKVSADKADSGYPPWRA
jgi:hypothetical protein